MYFGWEEKFQVQSGNPKEQSLYFITSMGASWLDDGKIHDIDW